ncbi:MAG: hypothetical protein A2Z57_05105 [Planctomycetes bacterium RIFCSPHIGHO2_12_39_6]|nr:MAG: hypothetical protein A2Z57_05105 [Planctomycetes bacterium RIFCSPHIGHO2_12_39_6]
MSSNVSYKKIIEARYNLAPSQLKVLTFANSNYLHVRDFLDRPLKTSDRGVEVGSANYIRNSYKFFIRAKSLTSGQFLPEINTEEIKPIRPQVFVDYKLSEGDILISKDSNIGESVILDKDYFNCMLSGALYKLPVSKKKYYLLAFFKSSIFKDQLDLMVPKGATIRHAKTLFLDCKIPLPNQENLDDVISYVEELTKSIVNKEKEIRKKNEQIFTLITDEINCNQKNEKFKFTHPRLNDLQIKKRLDTGMYNKKYQEQNFLIRNYGFGTSTFKDLGYKISRGQNLQVSSIGRSIYTDFIKKNFYKLALSKYFSEWMTVEKYIYLGNAKKLKVVNKGDIIFSCRGDLGRVAIICESIHGLITNIDNVHIINNSADINNKIFVASFLNYLRRTGYLNQVSITGSGANSFTKYHFDHIIFPNFPSGKQAEIAKIFYNDVRIKNMNINDYYKLSCEWDAESGVYNLDLSLKKLKIHLNKTLQEISEGKEIKIDFSFINSGV